MVSLPIDFVSHPKIPVSLRSETSETGGSVSLFREKKFRYVSLQFRFEAKFGDTLALAERVYTLYNAADCICRYRLSYMPYIAYPDTV